MLSSGARSAFELRGPPDAANLATLFGLSQRQAKVSQIRSIANMRASAMSIGQQVSGRMNDGLCQYKRQ